MCYVCVLSFSESADRRPEWRGKVLRSGGYLHLVAKGDDFCEVSSTQIPARYKPLGNQRLKSAISRPNSFCRRFEARRPRNSMSPTKLARPRPEPIPAHQPVDHCHAYIISGAAYRVSIHSQQLRAITLIKTLCTEYPDFDGVEDVAVIGGGFAGVTAAAALSAYNKRVTIYERHAVLMRLQSLNRNRFLHPNTVIWPDVEDVSFHTGMLEVSERYLSPVTDLPFLNWFADYANNVADRVQSQFNTVFRGSNPHLRVCLNHDVQSVSYDPTGKFEVAFKEAGLGKNGVGEAGSGAAAVRKHDCVVFAHGFNREKSVTPFCRHSYWEEASTRPVYSHGIEPRVAMIGDGDGAVIDTLRCFMRSETLEDIYRRLPRAIGNDLVEDLAKHEREFSRDVFADRIAARQSGNFEELPDDDRGYYESQRQLYTRIARSEAVVEELEGKIQFPACVKIFATSPSPFSPNASPLHKIILAYLIDIGRVEACQAFVLNAEHVEADDTYALSMRQRVNGDLTQRREAGFDRVIVRAGPGNDLPDLLQTFFESLESSSADIVREIQTMLADTRDHTNPVADKANALRDAYHSHPALGQIHFKQSTRFLREFIEKRLNIRCSMAQIIKERSSTGRDTEVLEVELIGDGDENSLQHIPPVWFGYPVKQRFLKTDPPR